MRVSTVLLLVSLIAGGSLRPPAAWSQDPTVRSPRNANYSIRARLDPEQSRRYLAAWDRAPIGLCRDFVKLLRSCALLAYLDHPLVTRQLEASAGLEAAR